MTYEYTTAATLAREIRAGEVSPVDVLDDLFAQIDAHDDAVNAFTYRREADAYEAAREAERAVEEGRDLGPLHGVPVAIKDLDTPVEGAPMTCGSAPLADNVAEEDCLPVQRLKSAGAIVVGMTPLAIGSDAGGSIRGSIRIPASACGIAGLMPSFGLVPFDARPDALEAHSPFTALGPMARSVEDVALMLDVLVGWDASDPFSVPAPEADYVGATRRGADSLSVGYSPDLGIFPMEDVVRDIVEEAVTDLDAAGASVTPSEPAFGHDYETMLAAWEEGFKLLLSSLPEKVEQATGIDLWGEHRDELMDQFVAYIEAGLDQSAAEFKRADMVRTDVYDAVNDVLADNDVFVTATLATPPFDADIAGPTAVDGHPVDPYFGWPLTWVFNLTGHPVLSVPAGVTDDGLPVGLQIVGQRFDDETVLAAGAAIERIRPWDDHYPPAGIA
ncbi:amidase [Halobacteriales archaeon QH_6_66_25]|nr:MAG: amidase [Halobacteriales archaeon QH_6_66_25]